MTRARLPPTIRRNCSSPTSPEVNVSIQEGTDEVWSSVMLATECSNLVSLDCSHHWLNQPEAEACLRLLPSNLESLELDTTFHLISDPSLQRLQHLTRLGLTGSCSDEGEATVSAAGLQGLQSLEIFNGTGCDGVDDYCNQLDPATFVHSSLIRLELARDIFDRPFGLTGLPALHTIAVYSNEPLPSWLMGQPFSRLVMWSVGQLSSCSLEKLLFKELEIICDQDDEAWYIQQLLEMPQLRQLEGTPSPTLTQKRLNKCTPLTMVGSHQEHERLLQRVCLILGYPFQLQLSPGTVVPLRKNGHAFVCVCPACLHADALAVQNRPLRR